MKELMAAVDEHEATIVALVDRDHAHVFRVFMGQVENTAQLQRALEHDTHLHEAEGRHQWHVRQHLERVLAVIRDRRSTAPDRVLVGGGKETVHELLKLMPPRVRGRTRLVAGLSVHSSAAHVLARVVEEQQRAEREEEEELLDNLLEGDRSRAVFGPAPVIEATSDDRVHTLVYGAGAAIHGAECDACRWMTVGEVAVCPRCGGGVHAGTELVERMVHRVLATGGRVEEVRGPASRIMRKWEGVAALLRYQPHAQAPPIRS